MKNTASKQKVTSRPKQKITAKSGKRIAVTYQEAQSNRRLLMACFTLVFSALGVVLLSFGSAATAQTLFSGTLSKKQQLKTYAITTNVSGSINATLTNTKTSTPLRLRLLQGATVIAQSSGTSASLSAPVSSGSFSFEVSESVTTTTPYTLSVSYPIPDSTPPVDTTPPSAPTGLAASAMSSNQINLVWQSATDNVGVTSYDVLRNGVIISQSTTTTYNDVNLTPSTLYSYTVRARDAAGNIGAVSNMVSATTPAAADTVSPTISITTPTANQTVSGTTTISGSASDNTGQVSVAVQIDSAGYVPASYAATSGTWSYSLNSTLYSDGNHTLSTQATDASGNTKTSSVVFVIANNTAVISSAPDTQGTWTSPEGTVISVATTQLNPVNGQPYTIRYIYDMLKQESAAPGDFGTIAPHLTIKLQDTYSSSTSASATNTNGVYSNFHATMYLRGGTGNTFGSRPNATLSHEYGHVWTNYYYFIAHQASYAEYTATRWSGLNGNPVIGQDSRLNSTYNWSTPEMIADDYRLLFGTSTAQNATGYINSDVVDPRNQPGLANWYLTKWK